MQQIQQAFDQRAFAGAVGPHQTDGGPGGNGQIDSGQHLLGAETFGQVVDFDGCGHALRS